ncbi:MAG: heme o synthase, partial [Acidimicrobiales bacterium]
PLPRHAVSPSGALSFGVALSVASFAWLTLTVNLLSALLAASAIGFYVFVYTLWLKRSSPNNVVIGGAAGAVPVLVGWAAVTGKVEAAPLVLFAVIFVWTPPHFWALAIRYRDDYAAAEVPMLPAVAGLPATARRILAYSVALWAASLVFVPVAGMGWLYLGAALVLGGMFVERARRLLHDATPARAMSLFHFSISYVTLLFGAMAADQLLQPWLGAP